MTFLRETVRVSVPATSANLGPGYDCLGVALDWRDELAARVSDDGLAISVEGANAEGVPRDASHLIFRAMRRGFETMGFETPGLALHCVNAVPHARGLGSSASAIVGGLCLARGLVSDPAARLSDLALLQIAAVMEGHPDNVAAALFGGFVVSGQRTAEELAASGVSMDAFFAHPSPIHPDVAAVVFVPGFEVETKISRGLLPATVLHADAAKNTGRAALLVAALAGAPELLVTATRDYLHQDYREPVMPQTLALVRQLRALGFAAVVSGAGPTVLVLTTQREVSRVAENAPPGWESRVVSIDLQGARTT